MIIVLERSLRVTDETWKALGIAAECFGMTRADYLEQVIRDNASPSITWTRDTIDQAQTTVAELATTPLSVATLETLRDQVLLQLKLGKQAPGYKAALKVLNHFIGKGRGLLQNSLLHKCLLPSAFPGKIRKAFNSCLRITDTGSTSGYK